MLASCGLCWLHMLRSIGSMALAMLCPGCRPQAFGPLTKLWLAKAILIVLGKRVVRVMSMDQLDGGCICSSVG